MTKVAQQILDQWQSLDEADKAELVDELSVMMEPSTDPSYVTAWGDEIRERIAQVERGEEKPIPWRQAMDQIRRGEVDGE